MIFHTLVFPKRPGFSSPIITDKEAYRIQVLNWTRLLAEQGISTLAYPPEQGGEGDIASYLAALETMAHLELARTLKRLVDLYAPGDH